MRRAKPTRKGKLLSFGLLTTMFVIAGLAGLCGATSWLALLIGIGVAYVAFLVIISVTRPRGRYGHLREHT
jgi:hypothetical protein